MRCTPTLPIGFHLRPLAVARSVHAGTYAGTPGTATNVHCVLRTISMRIEIATRDGLAPGHVFRPEGPGNGPWPAVLVFMDGIGIRPAMLEIGERLAAPSPDGAVHVEGHAAGAHIRHRGVPGISRERARGASRRRGDDGLLHRRRGVYARVPRASLRMTGSLVPLREEERKDVSRLSHRLICALMRAAEGLSE